MLSNWNVVYEDYMKYHPSGEIKTKDKCHHKWVDSFVDCGYRCYLCGKFMSYADAVYHRRFGR